LTVNLQFCSQLYSSRFSPVAAGKDETLPIQNATLGAFEGHLSYDVKQRLWFSLDSNFWVGGQTSLNGIENPKTLQKTPASEQLTQSL
jgi:hypothetical protein